MNKRATILCGAFMASAMALTQQSNACTNIIVTRGASKDNSAMVSYAADSHWLYGELYFHPAMDWKDGTMLNIVEWDTSKPLGQIPQAPHTYKTVGNMNEHQLIIGETTWGGRLELMDSTAIMDYGSLIYVALQRARTAREAIQVIVDLANEYGYASEGESFSIADKNEAWVMDLIGKGVEMKDGKNVNKGLVWVARSKGYFSGKDEDFDFSAAYNPIDFGGVRACDARAWSAFRILCDGKFTYEKDGKMITEDADDYLDYVMGKNLKHRMPLFVKPARKLGVKDVADAMRDHFEGTPLDMTQDIGAGGNALPYRWRPMGFKIGGWDYINERAIATQQTGFWFVGQARHDLPDVVGGVIWFGTDDAATSYLSPIYTNTDKVPECFREGNGTLLEYSPTASFWMNNRVTNTCYRAYNMIAPTVRAEVDKFENEQMGGKLSENDQKVLNEYNKLVSKAGGKEIKDKALNPIRKMLTEYSVNTAQNQFDHWVALEQLITVKFIDGNVKAQNEDGTFKHSKYDEGIPDGLTQPGYTEKWKEAVVKDHGDIIRVR